jgi:hypothetical protein
MRLKTSGGQIFYIFSPNPIECSHNKRNHLQQGLSPFQELNYTCGLLVLVYNAFVKIVFQVG